MVALPSGFSCDLKITNHGETPAQITDIVIHYKILDGLQLLPDVPDYGSAKKYRFSHAFLVRGESISYNFSEYISDDTIIDLQVGNKILSIYGYVDYIDAFNRSHRGGFGQNYYYFNDNRNHYTDDVAYIHRNNLTFLMQADYNFDRPRTDNTESTA